MLIQPTQPAYGGQTQTTGDNPQAQEKQCGSEVSRGPGGFKADHLWKLGAIVNGVPGLRCPESQVVFHPTGRTLLQELPVLLR